MTDGVTAHGSFASRERDRGFVRYAWSYVGLLASTSSGANPRRMVFSVTQRVSRNSSR